jgi:signal transduction histidine kinase
MAPGQAWSHALPLIVVLLSAGLLGSLLHKSVQAVLTIEVEQRHRLGAFVRALRQRERLLQHAMRIGTIGDMASMVVHQLRNQFQLMLGCVAVAEREPVGEKDLAEKDRRLRQIREAVQAASAMLEPLLHLAHPGEERLERVELARCCAALVERIRRILPAGIDVQLETENGLAVRVNPRDLEHALLNLVINAKHAMGRQGVLTIRALRRDHEHVQLVVSDTGHGIAPEHRPNLFKPYFTTKPVGEGTGLGLAAVARFMRFAGGDVEVESEPGKGATFTLIFPACASGGGQRVAG